MNESYSKKINKRGKKVMEFFISESNINDKKYKRSYDEHWSFKDGNMGELVHKIHPYPAMMMPLIARELFVTYGKGKDTIFFDPYVGSGTTLVEAQYYGAKKAIGIDLNPLAILIARTKTESINLSKVEQAFSKLDDYLFDNRSYEIPEFSIRDSWFSEKTIISLSKIRSFVFSNDDDTVRDFFKVAFSEVVRSSSETRNGEFKLYRMTKKSLENFNPDPIEMFKNVVIRNLRLMKAISYKKETDIQIYTADTRNVMSYSGLNENVDLIITSPPYGDSHTTVAYGQFSRLSNEWLGIPNAGTLDKCLLGGKKVAERSFDIEELDVAIDMIRENDKAFNRDRCWEVIAFYNDYEESIEAVAKTVRSGGYVVYVVGNRRVRNIELPLDVITYKMFEKRGFEHITTYVRDIINKRMPSKASPSNAKGGQISTMMYEYIVVMRKK